METTENYAAVDSTNTSSHLPNSTSSDSAFLHGGDDGASSERIPSPHSQSFPETQFHLSVLENKAAMSSPRATKRKRPHSEFYDGAAPVAGTTAEVLTRRSKWIL
jgi:hypothetical protein